MSANGCRTLINFVIAGLFLLGLVFPSLRVVAGIAVLAIVASIILPAPGQTP